MNSVIRVHAQDNVAVAIVALKAGESVGVAKTTIILKNDIAAGHKFALAEIKKGGDIIKYGFRIGVARVDIACGEYVHEHNVQTALRGDFTEKPELVVPHNAAYPELAGKNFAGYYRKDGSIGIRNELWIVPTVGCINASARKIARETNSTLNVKGVDGCYAFEPSLRLFAIRG